MNTKRLYIYISYDTVGHITLTKSSKHILNTFLHIKHFKVFDAISIILFSCLKFANL